MRVSFFDVSKGTLMKFYTDAHISKAIAVQARKRGLEVVRCQDIGKENDSDESHLEYAAYEGMVVVTADEDFPILHKVWMNVGKSHHGIIYIDPQRKDNVGMVIDFLETAQGAGGPEDMQNRIYYL
jgi:hypothetical protein